MDLDIVVRVLFVTRAVIETSLHAAASAYVNLVFIACVEHSVFAESCHAMCQHDISLHLSYTESTITTPSLCGLSCQIHHGTYRTTMLLVIHHVFQSLVIDGTDKDARF